MSKDFFRYNYCERCGWPVILCLGNGEICDYSTSKNDDGGGDYLAYCVNKTCSNHKGEWVASASGDPEWAVEKDAYK